VVLVAGGVTGWLVTQSGGPSAPALTWTAAQAPLPDDARGGGQLAALYNVSCPSVTECVAVGSYNATSASTGKTAQKPLMMTETNGVWSPGGDVIGTAKPTEFSAISCPAERSCEAVGDNAVPNGNSPVSLVAGTLSGSTWTAVTMPIPANATSLPSASLPLQSIACSAPGTCVAVGGYGDKNGDSQALIETLSGGKWTAAEAPLPSDVVLVKTSNAVETFLSGVACPSVGFCVAVGDYPQRGGASAALSDTLSGGKWTPQALPLPANAAKTGQLASLSGIACQGTGSCVATGHYVLSNGQSGYLVETLSNGTWTATQPPMPTGITMAQKPTAIPPASLNPVACQAAGSCVSFGVYQTSSEATDASLDTLSGGKWTATPAPLPLGSANTTEFATIDSIACPALGHCVAVGDYNEQTGDFRPVIETATSAETATSTETATAASS
jgi:hypothetical protein